MPLLVFQVRPPLLEFSPTTLAAAPWEEVLKYYKTKFQDIPKPKNALKSND
jgi:hypothetical protein